MLLNSDLHIPKKYAFSITGDQKQQRHDHVRRGNISITLQIKAQDIITNVMYTLKN